MPRIQQQSRQTSKAQKNQNILEEGQENKNNNILEKRSTMNLINKSNDLNQTSIQGGKRKSKRLLQSTELSLKASKDENHPQKSPRKRNSEELNSDKLNILNEKSPLTNQWSLTSQKDSDPDSKKTYSSEEYQKNSKGLKFLSVVVKDIVLSKTCTTYKEVAEIILNENDSVKNSLTLRKEIERASKEEQNVKRRVYDALNVLISAEILLKNGKKVMKNPENQLIVNNQLHFKVKYMTEILSQRENQITEARNNLGLLRKLIQRNKKEKHECKMRFPLVVLYCDNGIGNPKLEVMLSKDRKRVVISSYDRIIFNTEISLIKSIL